MKILIEETKHEGSAVEILEQLWNQTFDPTEFPDADSYLWYLQGNYTRLTDQDCVLPEGSLEQRARAMFAKLEKIGALTVLEEG